MYGRYRWDNYVMLEFGIFCTSWLINSICKSYWLKYNMFQYSYDVISQGHIDYVKFVYYYFLYYGSILWTFGVTIK